MTASNFSGIQGVTWAPDGRIVYTSMERENLDLWMSNADGTNATQLTFEPAADLYPSVCPDGRYIVFVSNRGMRWGVWRMKLDGSEPIELVRNTREYALPVCSMDSRWVIYAAEVDSKEGLWKVPIDGGAPVQLVARSTFSHTLSPDGKSLAYYHRPPEMNARAQIEIVSIHGGPPLKILPAPGDVSRLRWSPDSTALDYVQTAEGVSNLWRLPLNSGPERQLTSFASDSIFWFAWSADGKRLACTRGSYESDLVLIENLPL